MNLRHLLTLAALIGLWLLAPGEALADNCGSLSDCYNTLRAALAAAVGVGVLGALISLGLDFIPGIGTLKGGIEAITGRDLVTGQELAWWERTLGVVPFIGGIIGTGASLARATDRVAEAADVAGDVARAGRGADRAADAAGAVRAADRAGDAADAVGDMARAGRGADAAGDAARAGRGADAAEDVPSLVNKYGDEARQIVEDYGDDIGGDILRTYDEIADVDGADQLLKDVLAGDSTAQGALAEIGYAASLKRQGVAIERVGDVIDGKKAGDILIKNGPVIDVKDYNWASRYYRSPSNVQKAKDSILRQVQKHRQRYPGRPIEYAFTDLANTPSEIIDALQEIGVGVRQVTWIGR